MTPRSHRPIGYTGRKSGLDDDQAFLGHLLDCVDGALTSVARLAYPDLRRHAPEGLFGHYLMMVGALGGAGCRAPGVRYSDYESAAGTGQVHMWFERPDAGWTG